MTYAESRNVYRSAQWQRVRRAVLARADWTCARCGRTCKPDIHHKVPMTKGGAPFDIRNLEAVCRPCHYASHPKGSSERQAWDRAWRALL